MRVLQVTTHFNIGGIANYILSLSASLKKKGVEVMVASSGGNMAGGLNEYGIPHIQLDIKTKFEFAPKVLLSGIKLAGIVKDKGIDVIHAHTRVSQVACAIACRLTGAKCVTTCHGYFNLRSRKIFDTWGQKVIAISDAVGEHLKKDLGVDGERIAVIYNGVDPERFSKQYSAEEIGRIKKTLGLGDGPVVGTIGRLSPVKGQKFLVEAMGDVISKRRDAQALIVGDGEEAAVLKEAAASLNIRDAIRFAGSDPDTRKFLSVMDVFVFPSIKEGLGLALLEAMAAGRPCVASNVGGIADVIKDGSSGILVAAGSAGAIAGAILKLLGDERMRESMGETGRAIVRERFSLDLMTDRTIALYKDVLR